MFSIQKLHFPYYTLKDGYVTPALDIQLTKQQFDELSNYVVLNIFFNHEQSLKDLYGINYYAIYSYFQNHSDFVIVDDPDRSKYHASIKQFYNQFSDTTIQVSKSMEIYHTNYVIQKLDDLSDSVKVYTTFLYLVDKYVLSPIEV